MSSQLDVSLDFAYQRVRDKVQIAKPRLPSDIEEPVVSEFDVEDIPIMSINLAGAFTVTQLKEIAEDLGDEIEKSPDILEVELVGTLEREVKVDVDIRALQGIRSHVLRSHRNDQFRKLQYPWRHDPRGQQRLSRTD